MASNGLPGSLFEFYAFYKKGTRALISWLSANGTNVTERTYVKSVEELKYLASTVISRRIQMSASLLRDLKDTVRARTRVSKFFKSLAKPGDQEQTSSHEYFTATLLQIHEEFQQLAKSAKTSSVSSPVTSTKPPSNVFEHLQNDKRTNNDHGSPTSPRRVTPTESVDQPSRPDEVSRMKSDDIGEFMALAMYLSQLENLMATVKETWQNVASGSIPMVVAAATNNMAYRAALALEEELEEYEIFNPDQFLARYTTCLHSLNLSGPSSMEASKTPPELAPFRQYKGPQQGWLALKRFKSFWDTNGASAHLQAIPNCHYCQADRPCTFPSDDPIHYIPEKTNYGGQDDKQFNQDRICMELMLKRMGQLLTVKYLDPQTQVPFHTPLLQELAYFLTRNTNTTIHGALPTLALSFGLEMLVQGMKSFLERPKSEFTRQGIGPEEQGFPLSTRRGNGRVQSLKLAIGIQQSIAHLMAAPNPPCGCLQIGSVGVAQLLITAQEWLYQFVNTKRFDIFYQAPWISGQHMVEHLSMASDFGAKAWHHAYYVGTTLHTYNTLVKLEVIKPSEFPLMERLCNLFKGAVFLGQRPSRNLLSCYQRWGGGSLSFPKGHCRGMHTHTHSQTGKKWGMKYVRDASQGGDNPNRGYDPAKISLFSLLSAQKFVLGDQVLAWVYCSKPWSKATKKDIQEAHRKRDADPFASKSIEAVQEKLLGEFQGDFPVARINHFAIYELCVEILIQIHRAEHPKEEPDLICSCSAGRLMGTADLYLDDTRLFKAYADRSLLEHTQHGFSETLKGKTLANFLWDV